MSLFKGKPIILVTFLMLKQPILLLSSLMQIIEDLDCNKLLKATFWNTGSQSLIWNYKNQTFQGFFFFVFFSYRLSVHQSPYLAAKLDLTWPTFNPLLSQFCFFPIRSAFVALHYIFIMFFEDCDKITTIYVKKESKYIYQFYYDTNKFYL